MKATSLIRWRGAPVPQPVLVFVAVHVMAIVAISTAAAWAGADAPVAPIEPWLFSSAKAVAPATAPAPEPHASPVRSSDLPAWVVLSSARDGARPWTEAPDGRIETAR